jgi:UBX domain-containing protein 1/4
MPTFLFFKKSQQVDMQRGADPGALEAKVLAHKVDTAAPFAGKGHSLSASSSAPNQPAMGSREARLAAFAHIDAKKSASSTAPPTTATAATSAEVDDEDEALAKAIALSVAEEASKSQAASSTPSTAKAATAASDEVEDDLVPLPVNVEILGQLVEMGFSDVRGRKAIFHGQSLEGALAWLDEHQGDADIDNPYLVKREDAERHDANGNRIPMSEEEKAQKMKELQEKAKRIREAKARKAKEDEIIREKERRDRGKKIDTITEEREKILKKHEQAKLKKEKEDAKKERERLLAEIARDKEIRKKNAGVIPSVLGVDGYNPSAVQYDKPAEGGAADQSGASGTATAKASSSSSTSAEPVAKKQATGKPSAAAGKSSDLSPEQKVDTAITLIAAHRLRGEGGNALKLLITFLKNLVENPSEAKYRSINMESNAFKTKLTPILGTVNLLLAVGFEKMSEEGVDKLKYNHE